MRPLSSLSAFFPVYNEEQSLEGMVTAFLKVLPGVAEWFEILIIDDGSDDRSGWLADALAKQHDQVRVVHHPHRLGYGSALRSGLAHSRGDFIFFTDGDQQFDIADIGRLLPYVYDYDLIIGYRMVRSDHLGRRLNSLLWNWLVRQLFHLRLRDINCAFKLIRRGAIESIPLGSTVQAISAELLAKAHRAGLSIKEIAVPHYPRRSGKPTGAQLRVIAHAFVELARLYRELNRHPIQTAQKS